MYGQFWKFKLLRALMESKINNLLIEFILAMVLLFLGVNIPKFGWVLIVFSYVLCGDMSIASLSLIKKTQK